MMSKFTVILVNEYITVLAIVAPALVYFGILAKAGPAYWTNALIVYLLLPVIPLAIVSLLVVGMMRVVNLSRKKDALIIVGSLVLIAAGMGLQFVLNRSAGSKPDPQAMIRFFSSPNSLLQQVGTRFPPSIWATQALAGGFSRRGTLNLLIFVGTSLFLFFGMLVLAERLFYRGLIGIGEISSRKKALSPAEMSRLVSSGRRPVKAIFWREWRIMNRTPIFLLNGVLTVIIIPLIFVIMARTGTGDNAVILKALGSAKSGYVIPAAACFLLICSCLNGTSSSAFSREGGQFWMSKVIPVAPREQVAAKFLHSYIIAVLGIGAGSVVLMMILHLKASVSAVAILFALVGAIGLTAVGMIIDLARPLLEWTNPQKAIKQNLNVLLAIFADLGILGILGVSIRLLAKARISGNTILIIMFAILILLSLISWSSLLRFAEKRYQEIEA
jgi:ABC-2 type transport system permease protein